MDQVPWETVKTTFEKYRKNKTQVAPEDLAGKYKTAFDRLREQLRQEVNGYFLPLLQEGMEILNNEEGEAVCRQLTDYLENTHYGRRCGKAVFKDLDLDEAARITQEAHDQAYAEIYKPYFDKHTCLYATAECWEPENPQTPRIYNDIINKFYDDATGKWITDEAESQKPAILIFVGDKKKEEAES